MTACTMAWASGLFPVPGGPRKSASSWRATNVAVARSKTKLRFIFLLKLKSKLSRVAADREIALASSVAPAVVRHSESVHRTPDRRRSRWVPSVPLGLAAGASPAPQPYRRDAVAATHDSTRSDSF